MRREGRPAPLPIRSVRVGPTSLPRLAVDSVRRLLDANGYISEEIEVTQSRLPLRL